MKDETYLSPREKFIAREISWSSRRVSIFAIVRLAVEFFACAAFVTFVIFAIGAVRG